ncbi:MAG: pyruvate formate lyase [Oscillospiraceae bacterium]|nr:pyruvate formate lyase [Oscillospiraceae bacterium]
MNERIEKMRENVQQLNDAGIRRTLFYRLAYSSLAQTRGESIQLRRAKAQAHLLDNTPLEVHPHELIAGSMTGLCPLLKNPPPYETQREKAVQIIEKYLCSKGKVQQVVVPDRNAVKTFEAEFTTKKSRWALMSRVHHDADISYQDLQKLIVEMREKFADKDIEKYEIGRELERAFKINYGKEVRAEIDALPWFAANHLALNYGRIIRQGFDGLLTEIEKKLQSAQTDAQREYYTCAKIVAVAGSRFVARYASELRQHSQTGSEPRKSELAEMARVCEKITTAPASTFREAVQFVWLLHIMVSVTWGSALSLGRFDQYMSEFYLQDIASHSITREEAKELLCCLWLKVNEPKMRTVQSLTLGGITPEGKCAVNELTALCLDVVAEMKLPYPNVGLRINNKNPQWLYDFAIQTINAGGGQPMIMNDTVWIANLKKLGYADKYANDYYNMGCVEIMIPGKQPNWGVTDPIAFPMLFEDVFAKYRAGEAALENFEQFKQVYLQTLSEAVAADKREADSKAAQIPGKCYDPLASLMTDGCLEAGSDMFQGGSELGTHWSFYAYGLGTAADSMAAVKKHVYDEGRFTIAEIADLLAQNFADSEEARQILAEMTPNYGNDIDEVDALANDILTAFDDQVMSYNSAQNPNKYVTTLFGYFFHIYHGEITGATPNGRRRGEAFSDSMGPSQGKDIGGPTKMLNSVLKFDHGGVTGGYALNLKVNPALAKSPAGTLAFKALLQAYLQDGGPQLQIYIVDVAALKAAKEQPEKHRDLIVRIGGYCEYFVNLDESLQEEIIERTVHGL